MRLPWQVNIEPFRAPTHPPDDIVCPFPQIVADVTATDPLQGGEIQLLYPVLTHEAAQQVFHHLGVGKQIFVAVVVVVHGEIGYHIPELPAGTPMLPGLKAGGADHAHNEPRRGRAGSRARP